MLSYNLLSKRFHFKAIIREPLFHLYYRIRIVQVCQLLKLQGELCFGSIIKCNGIFYHSHINHDSTVVNFLVYVEGNVVEIDFQHNDAIEAALKIIDTLPEDMKTEA